ncbi:hypothetical protein EYF80_041685 [Liparis tanakae]|uniref:Uncharacterized protein n=1 Tax=Liparis tanakae TaxID=230148 RepID=A0A4Z2G5R4_9TELE|nr:hypothetical protein EYF80_041685 [Liparis tanakae]
MRARRPILMLRHNLHEALWGVALDGQGERSIIFLREETAFTLQNEQNKLAKARSPRGSKGHGAVCGFPRSHQTCGTHDRWMGVIFVFTWGALEDPSYPVNSHGERRS